MEKGLSLFRTASDEPLREQTTKEGGRYGGRKSHGSGGIGKNQVTSGFLGGKTDTRGGGSIIRRPRVEKSYVGGDVKGNP